MTIPPKLLDDLLVHFRGTRQRLTPARKGVIGALYKADRPVSIPEIQKLNRKIPKSSLYRNLVSLEASGVVRKVVTNSEFALYELAEKFSEHHHHLICDNCGRVEDFQTTAKVESALNTLTNEVERTTGFVTQFHSIDLTGLCAKCAGRPVSE